MLATAGGIYKMSRCGNHPELMECLTRSIDLDDGTRMFLDYQAVVNQYENISECDLASAHGELTAGAHSNGGNRNHSEVIVADDLNHRFRFSRANDVQWSVHQSNTVVSSAPFGCSCSLT